MPHYYFDIQNGHRLIDPSGLDCRDDQEAIRSAISIARRIAADAHPDQPRHIAVLNGDRQEVGNIAVEAERKSDHHGG